MNTVLFQAVYKYVHAVGEVTATECLSKFLCAGHASFSTYDEACKEASETPGSKAPPNPFISLRSLFNLSCLSEWLRILDWESNCLGEWNPESFVDKEGKKRKLWKDGHLNLKGPLRLRQWISEIVNPQAEMMALLAIIAGPSKLGFYADRWYEKTEKQNFAHNWFTPG